MPRLEEVLAEGRGPRGLRAEHVARLNDAVFNLDDEEAVGHVVASRLFGAARRLRDAQVAGRLAPEAWSAYVALLGTLQNARFFVPRQFAWLHTWLAEALAAGAGLAAARGEAEAAEARLSELRSRNGALRAELGRLEALQQAVLALRDFRPPGAEEDRGRRRRRGEAAAGGAAAEAGSGASSARAAAGRGPRGVEWQVETDSGFQKYPQEAQAAIQAAVAKGIMCCEVYVNSQYYRIDFARMLQVNPLSHKERKVRVLGAAPPTPPMPKLNFRRLIMEFRQVEKAIASGLEPGLLRCEPVEDNLMEWEVEMSFPEDSKLQMSLENLAACMFSPSLNRVTLCVRFPVEFPMSPPEVWLRRPRMKHQSGPVTFGGRICTILLASAGWQPGTSMMTVLREVRTALVEADLEANTAVSVKKEYPRFSMQLQRLKSELFPTANDFDKDGMTVLSPAEAATFLGDLSRLEATDKIGLPFSYAEEIYSRAEKGGELVLPLIFEVKTLLGRKTHCAIFEFIEGLPEMHALLPKWVMEDLDIQEREPVRIRGVDLELITFAKVQPHSVDFYQAVRDSGCEIQELLQESLSRFSALTEDNAVPIVVGDRTFNMQIVDLRPHGSVRIIDMDVQHHFQFEVDFEPAPDLEDEAATKAHHERLIEAFRLRRERSEAGREELRERRAEARRKRFQDERERLRRAAGEQDGQRGGVEVVLRLPTGAKLEAKFSEGAPVAALASFVFGSQWADECQPWGVYLRTFPSKTLHEGDLVTKDLHRAAISVQEEQAPDKDENLFAVLQPTQAHRGRSFSSSSGIEPLEPPPLPERNERELEARTQRAFEMQRFIRAGYDPAEAAERYAAGEILPPTVFPTRAVPRPPLVTRCPPALAAAPPHLARERSVSETENEERERRTEEVMNFTGVDRDTAVEALKGNDWVTESAVNSILDSLMDG